MFRPNALASTKDLRPSRLRGGLDAAVLSAGRGDGGRASRETAFLAFNFNRKAPENLSKSRCSIFVKHSVAMPLATPLATSLATLVLCPNKAVGTCQ